MLEVSGSKDAPPTPSSPPTQRHVPSVGSPFGTAPRSAAALGRSRSFGNKPRRDEGLYWDDRGGRWVEP